MLGLARPGTRSVEAMPCSRRGLRRPHHRPVPAPVGEAPATHQVLHARRVRAAAGDRPRDGLPARPVWTARALVVPRGGAGPRSRGSGGVLTVHGNRYALSRHQRATEADSRRAPTPRSQRAIRRPATTIRCCWATAASSPSTASGRWRIGRPWELQDELAIGVAAGGSVIVSCRRALPRTHDRRGGDESKSGRPERLRGSARSWFASIVVATSRSMAPRPDRAYPIVELGGPLDLRRYVRTIEAAVIVTAGASASRATAWRAIRHLGRCELKLGRASACALKRCVTTHGPRPQRQQPTWLVRRDDPVWHPRQGRGPPWPGRSGIRSDGRVGDELARQLARQSRDTPGRWRRRVIGPGGREQ